MTEACQKKDRFVSTLGKVKVRLENGKKMCNVQEQFAIEGGGAAVRFVTRIGD